ncbi:uncharacterized protein FOMMEDRAFT_160705 [Fomitiporia mediterranea MF3/22]|uniref:uncharacterized protein n=1 Tax=Fomitiporia mediterranea (strain MF3/22) TaxID=694068 RepID=UPI0004407E64|nr:uncharacterized protein FOMMEDRAFT_160705 [Fomitiporia mediterranea MF3/22]EJC99139.1 hypothetical protein FOMMEDRAFT_160705 [Fomitiporia mediterranea MF3/22]
MNYAHYNGALALVPLRLCGALSLLVSCRHLDRYACNFIKVALLDKLGHNALRLNRMPIFPTSNVYSQCSSALRNTSDSEHCLQRLGTMPQGQRNASEDRSDSTHSEKIDVFGNAVSDYNGVWDETHNTYKSALYTISRLTISLKFVNEGSRALDKAVKTLKDMEEAESQKAKETEASTEKSGHSKRKSISSHLVAASTEKSGKRAGKAFHSAVDELKNVKRRHYELSCANFSFENARSDRDQEADKAIDRFFDDACYLLNSRSVAHCGTASEYWIQLIKELILLSLKSVKQSRIN